MTVRTRVAGAFPLVAVATAAMAMGGCARGPETAYGSTRGTSLNGTGAFAALVGGRGHEVRTALRLTEELAEWANVIVRFAMTPGPPSREEADWYEDWLEAAPGRVLVYVVRDYDARPDYWRLVLDQFDKGTDEDQRKEAERRRDKAKGWTDELPSKAKSPADASDWFAVDQPMSPPEVGKVLEGPWAEGVDAEAAAIPVHESLKADPNRDRELLLANGRALAIGWETRNRSSILILANGAFLLNLPLAIPGRRPLADRVLDWIGHGRRHVAFVDGPTVLGGPRPPPNLFELLGRIPSFRWAAVHLGLFGVVAALARAPRLGRPRPDPRPDNDRPAAHAEALGTLLERARSREVAVAILSTYRQWRHPRHPIPNEPRR